MNHNPVLLPKGFIAQPFVDFSFALAGGVGIEDGGIILAQSGSTA